MPGRFGRVRHAAAGAVRVGAATVGVAALVATAALAILVVTLDTSFVRRTVVAQVNARVLAPLFRGTVSILSVEHLDPSGIAGARFSVSDAAGRTLLLAEGIDCRIATFTLLRTLAFGHGDLVIDLQEVAIRNADLRLDMDEAGLAFGNAFLLRSEPTSPRVAPHGHGVRVRAPHIRIERAWVHGQMTGVPYVDADVARVDGGFSLGAAGLSVDARSAHVLGRGIALGADAEGDVRGRFELEFGEPLVMRGRVEWEGRAGMVAETAMGALGDGRVDATLDIREASAGAIRSVWRSSTLRGAAAAHVEAHGRLDAVELRVQAKLEVATLDLRGVACWGVDKGATLHLTAERVDLQQLSPTLETTELGVRGDVAVGLGQDGRIDGSGHLASSQGRVGAHVVPGVTLDVTAFRSATGSFGGDALAQVDEPGAPITVTVHAAPDVRAPRVEFTVAAHDARLGAIGELTPRVNGMLHLYGEGGFDLDRRTLDVRVEARGDRLRRGLLSIGAVTLRGRGHGGFANPQLDLVLHARDVAWAQTKATVLDISARGSARSPHVTVRERSSGVPDLDAELDLELRNGASLRRASVLLAAEGERVRVQVGRAHLSPGHITMDGLVVDGLGAPATGSFAEGGGAAQLQIHAPRLEVARVARLLRRGDEVRGGTLAVDVNVALRAGGASGQARVTLADGTIGSVDGVSAFLDARIAGRTITGTARMQAGNRGSVEFGASDIVLGEGWPLSGSSWRDASGGITLAGHVDLDRLAPEVRKRPLALAGMGGVVDFRGRLLRDGSSDPAPAVELSLTTKNLLLRGAPVNPVVAGANSGAPAAWTIEGVDLSAALRLDAKMRSLALTTHFMDARGDLAVLDASSNAVPYEAIAASPSEALRLVRGVPFHAHVSIPPRAVETWPASFARLGLDGVVHGELDAEGPLTSPHVTMSATLARASAARARLTNSVDAELRATYDGARADVTLRGSQGTRDVLTAQASAFVRASDVLAGEANLPWRASAKAHLDEFPLETVGALDDLLVEGSLSGDLEIQDLHADARARGAFRVPSLRIGDVRYENASVTLGADGKDVEADLHVDQRGGFASLKARVKALWGAALLPVAAPDGALEASLEAKHLRAAIFLPLVRGSVDEIDGLIDADARATVDPRSRRVHVEGSVAVTDGLIELASYGGELHDIAGKVTVTPDGLLTLENVTASGVSGQIRMAASARLRGLQVTAANATLVFPRSHALPLSVAGLQLGTVEGTIHVSEVLSADQRSAEVKVEVPSLHLVLPDAASRNVQDLGVMSGVTLGRHVGPDHHFAPSAPQPLLDAQPTAGARAASALKVRVVTHLGDDVFIRRGTSVRVQLRGGPTVTLGEKAVVSGEIQIPAGVLNLYGKSFHIEHGTVAFVGEDATNPLVNVAAEWAGPDGTQVQANFLGRFKTGKVTLHTEPSLSQNEIMQLLTFGTSVAQPLAPQGAQGAGTMEGVAASLATNPLNDALGGMGLTSVSTKVDTTSVSAKPEVDVQLTSDISVHLAHILYLGPVPPGSAPDTTLLTVAWRILRRWHIEATVGDAGSAIADLVWLYRY